MPTGYTSDIYEGKDITVKDFISQCARAFGAYVMVRDEPLDAKVPDKFKPDTYHLKQLEKSKERLAQYQCMTTEEIEKKIDEDYHDMVKGNEKYYQEKIQLQKRYFNMLEKVEAWNPPTPEHNNLKDFCIKQLNESIQFDCGSLDKYESEKVKKQTPEEWINRRIESCLWDIEYHSKGWESEIKRVNERNAWIKQLKESLEKLQ